MLRFVRLSVCASLRLSQVPSSGAVHYRYRHLGTLIGNPMLEVVESTDQRNSTATATDSYRRRRPFRRTR